MIAGPVARAARGGLTRRRIQTIILGLVVLVSTGASVLALALVVDSSAPFDRAFAAQRGADVAATIQGATRAQLAASARRPDVTAAAGPYAQVSITPKINTSSNVSCEGSSCGSAVFSPITVVGRASPGGAVDKVDLQSGHWPRRAGQVVIANQQNGPGFQVPLGSSITAANVPGRPKLTVVGYADSVTNTAGAWVTPGEIVKLTSKSTPASEQMLYQFRNAGSIGALRSDMATVSTALPKGSVTGTETWLAAKEQESGNIAPFAPFLVAFGIIGIVMSVLIVINVVSGAVVSGFRRIGILKSIGFTPGQVVGAYIEQVIIPAVLGAIGGLVLGNVVAAPILSQTATAYGVGALTVPVWVDVTVPLATCLLVGAAAVLSALRAGKLSAIQAIATGRAPRTGRGYLVHRVLSRVPLPRPATIGLAAPFARPARTALTMAAVLLGAIAVTFAVGLSSSLNLVVGALSHSQAYQVQVFSGIAGGGPGPQGHTRVNGPPKGGSKGGPTGSQAHQPTLAQAQHAIVAALRSEPGTLHYVAQKGAPINVPGVSQQVALTAFRGNSSWTGYDLIAGHWYSKPGQVDVPTHFLTVTGTRIGQSITMLINGKQVRAKIVGQVFSTDNNGLAIYTGWKTVASAARGLPGPELYDVALRPGTNAHTYISSLQQRLGTNYQVSPNARQSTVLSLMLSLTAALTLLLAVVAGLGVLNTVVLHTRERIHDLGVFKAIGMTPRQTIAMVVCWVAGTGLIAGVIAVPVGDLVHNWVLPAMASSADVGLPSNILNVYSGGELVGLGLAGVAIAVLGALLPATWAAATRTATALHAE